MTAKFQQKITYFSNYVPEKYDNVDDDDGKKFKRIIIVSLSSEAQFK